MINNLLVALDGSERADGVFRCGVDIAESHQAWVHLLRVIVVPPEFPPAAHIRYGDRLPAVMVCQAETQLRGFAARAPHVHVDVIVRASTQPWRLIIDVADEIGADLIVVGSHGYHGLDRLLGTNADKVANQAHRNVLVVHRPPDPRPPEGYRRSTPRVGEDL